MIDVASPARRSCVTVDACRSLCAGCTKTDSGPVATQWACGIVVCIAGDQRQRCGVTLVHTPQSLALRRRRQVATVC